MKLGPSRPRLSLRVNGTRIGDAARPINTIESAEPVVIASATTLAPLAAIDPLAALATTHLPTKRLVPRAGAALTTRPNTYMPDDDEAVS